MAKVFCFIPSFRGNINAATFESSHRLAVTMISKGIQTHISTFSWPDIEELRNAVLSYFYDAVPDFTHLLMIDDDMGFEPDMIVDMLLLDEPVVGAIYPKKTLPIDWVASGLEAKGDFRPGFIEVEALGTGCFLIRRDAVTKMIEQFPELIYPHITLATMRDPNKPGRTLGFFDQMRTPEGKVSEDISFCRRWRECGGKVWASIAYEITHVGNYAFTACFARDAKRKQDAA